MGIIVALIIFSLLVVIHEFGHFIVAKKSGVKVHEFAIGMGPKLFGKVKGDTLYSIRLFPLGGYVKMEGEDQESESEDSFSKKSIFARASIIFAGPLLNLITAVICFTIISLMLGVQTTTVNTVLKDSLAESIGMKSGDKILYINDKKVNDFKDIQNISVNKDGKIKFVVDREGKEKELVIEELKNDDKLGIEVKSETNLIKSISKGFNVTVAYSKEMLSSLWKLATGWIVKDTEKVELSGPVGIVNVISDVVEVEMTPKLKMVNIFNLLGILSLNLGLLNLVPFPALDGSRLLFIFLEAIRGGKKINSNVENLMYVVGFLFLMLFMVFVTIKDIIKLF